MVVVAGDGRSLSPLGSRLSSVSINGDDVRTLGPLDLYQDQDDTRRPWPCSSSPVLFFLLGEPSSSSPARGCG